MLEIRVKDQILTETRKDYRYKYKGRYKKISYYFTIKDINVNNKTIQVPGDKKMNEFFHNLGVGNVFLTVTKNPITIEG